MKNKLDSDKKYHISQETLQAASSTDCTGLIPSAPINMAEYESYRELAEELERRMRADGWD